MSEQKNRIAVRILPRDVILDTQGRAVEQSLRLNGFDLESCRVGRYVVLSLPGTPEEALASAKKISEFVLFNPLIETYQLEILK